jgi:hypothetical protein
MAGVVGWVCNGRGTVMTQPIATSSSGERSRHASWAILEDGALSGMVGASLVAFWFLVVDAIRGGPFLTPSLLGSVLFLGTSVEQVSGVSTVMVFAYTGLHGLLFLLAGTVIAWMFSTVERNPQFGLVLLLLFLLFQSIIFGFEVTLVPSLVGALGAWAVAVANLLAAIGMFWFLLRRRPEVMVRLREGWHE